MYVIKSPGFLNKISHENITWRMDPEKPDIYLTFDDGPVPDLTEKILDILEEKNVFASFFHVGDNVRKHPDIFKKVIDAGHSIGNHSFHHLNGWRSSNHSYIRDVNTFNDYYPTKLFRPPYGRIKLSQIRELRKYYHIVFWSILSGDFDQRTKPETCFMNVKKNLHNGAIIVFHDNFKAADNVLYALPAVIDYAKERGYTFKAIEQTKKDKI